MTSLLNPKVALAVVLALLAAFGGGFWRGAKWADQAAEVEALKKEKLDLETNLVAAKAATAEATRQARAAQALAVEDAERARQAADLAENRQGQLDDYINRLRAAEAKAAAPGGDRCVPDAFSDDDVRGVLGTSPRAPAGPGHDPAHPPGGSGSTDAR